MSHQPTRSTTRILASIATIALVGTASACASTTESVVEDMGKAVAAHNGDWTEADLRAAAGDYADKIETVTVDEDANGGVIYLVDGGHDKGDSYTKSKRKKSGSKTKTVTETKYHDEWELDCVKVVVDGTKVTAEEYERESSTEPVTCAN
jgi:hypothetical protein